MKQIKNSFIIAFSMYSKIPMPKCSWTKENMRYVMCFFPCIGIIIGLISYSCFSLMQWMTANGFVIPPLFSTAVLVLIPVVITGGIHLDGLLDTADALSSWQKQDRRLEILKDPHAGAFAIITCVCYFILYLGAYSMATPKSMPVISMGFVLSRTLSGLSVVTFPTAKGTGLAAAFSEGAQKKTVKICMLTYLLILTPSMLIFGKMSGLISLLTASLVFLYYYKMSIKNFGGITGDVAGYFLQICELCITLSANIVCG